MKSNVHLYAFIQPFSNRCGRKQVIRIQLGKKFPVILLNFGALINYSFIEICWINLLSNHSANFIIQSKVTVMVSWNHNNGNGIGTSGISQCVPKIMKQSTRVCVFFSLPRVDRIARYYDN